MYAKLKKPGSEFFEIKKVHTVSEDLLVFDNGKRLSLPTEDWEVELYEEVIVRGMKPDGEIHEERFVGSVAVYRETQGFMAEMADEPTTYNELKEDLVITSPSEVLFVRIGG